MSDENLDLKKELDLNVAAAEPQVQYDAKLREVEKPAFSKFSSTLAVLVSAFALFSDGELECRVFFFPSSFADSLRPRLHRIQHPDHRIHYAYVSRRDERLFGLPLLIMLFFSVGQSRKTVRPLLSRLFLSRCADLSPLLPQLPSCRHRNHEDSSLQLDSDRRHLRHDNFRLLFRSAGKTSRSHRLHFLPRSWSHHRDCQSWSEP